MGGWGCAAAGGGMGELTARTVKDRLARLSQVGLSIRRSFPWHSLFTCTLCNGRYRICCTNTFLAC